MSRFLIAFLWRSNRLLISWLQSPSAVILAPKQRNSVTTSTFSPSICHVVKGPDAMILVFLIFNLKKALSLSSFTLIKRFFSPSLLSAVRMLSSAFLRLLMFLPPIWIPSLGFPGGWLGKKIHLQYRRCRRYQFDSWVRKIPWRSAWQPTPVFLPGEYHGQRSLASYSP